MDIPDCFISICIPAYKRITFLKRLLDSIVLQTYKDYEVIITDDSPGDEVKECCIHYAQHFKLIYIKNVTSLGTPENWNEAVRRAKGTWIKLMHDDDWFCDEHSLQRFVDAALEHPNTSFFFSAYYNVVENTGEINKAQLSPLQKIYIQKLARLIARNVIGPPSVTLYKNRTNVSYDRQLKWLVDMEFYMQYLKGETYHYIKEPLVNIGISATQVTQSSFRVLEVEIPEHFYVFNKIGYAQLSDVIVYDAWWRLIRNLHIQSAEVIRSAGYNSDIPPVILSIIRHQNRLPKRLLPYGAFSKAFMVLSYVKNKKYFLKQ